MTSRHHPLISTLLAVLYGGMMLFGQGLHELVDCGHGHGHSDFHADADAHENGQCRHAHTACHAGKYGTANAGEHEHASEQCAAHAEHAHEAEDSRAGEHGSQSPALAVTDDVGSDSSDCPICQFHGQGQLRMPADASTERRVPTAAISRSPTLRLAEFTLGVHSPRGPPA